MDSMEAKELYEVAASGALLCSLAVSAGMTFYLGATLIATVAGSSFFHPRIRSQEELEEIISQEALKLDLDPGLIKCKFGTEESYAVSREILYEIDIQDNWMATRSLVKHELKHIKSGDCNKYEPNTVYSKIVSWLDHWLIEEPRVRLYQHFGIDV